MNQRHLVALVVLCGTLAAPVALRAADAKDAWITTKAKIRLLTADDLSVTGVNVDTAEGRVTLHGKVASDAERARAEAAVRGIDGVRDVRNLLQVVTEARRDLVKDKDEAIAARVGRCLDRQKDLPDVEVASVSDGVVLLSGETDTVQQELRAIEAVQACTAVRRVSSQIRTRQP
jgi:osmotically-inducible protein OsmY